MNHSHLLLRSGRNVFVNSSAFTGRPELLCSRARMQRRLYLGADGKEILPCEQGKGHYVIATSILAERAIPQGDAEQSYGQMWGLGFVRLVEDSQKVVAEQYPPRLSVA